MSAAEVKLYYGDEQGLEERTFIPRDIFMVPTDAATLSVVAAAEMLSKNGLITEKSKDDSKLSQISVEEFVASFPVGGLVVLARSLAATDKSQTTARWQRKGNQAGALTVNKANKREKTGGYGY